MAPKLRRGFVKEAEEYALEFREELGLLPYEPLDPFRLADHLSIPVWSLSEHPNIPEESKSYYLSSRGGELSGFAVPCGTYREIVVNDSHAPNRQRSSVAHELGHIILGHPPSEPFFGDGVRNYDSVVEQEANQLGFTLLVPKAAALHAIEEIGNTITASNYLRVSSQLLTFRINKSGARKIAERRAKKRAG